MFDFQPLPSTSSSLDITSEEFRNSFDYEYEEYMSQDTGTGSEEENPSLLSAMNLDMMDAFFSSYAVPQKRKEKTIYELFDDYYYSDDLYDYSSDFQDFKH